MLENVKALLGLESDSSLDSKLQTIYNLTTARLCTLIKEKTIPEDLRYIVDEVVIRRFNRIGSEGMSNHTVEGESIAYSGGDFDEFMPDIERYLKDQDRQSKKVIRFL